MDRIYQRLPVFLQNLACSIEGYRINRRRYSPEFFRLLSNYVERSLLSESDLRTWRDQQLSGFVQHAVATVPYYRRKFTEWGVSPTEIQTLEDLKKIPILTKAEVQENLTDLQSNAYRPKQITSIGTSGTTGTGLEFSATPDSQSHQWAVWWRYRLSHNIGLFQRCAVFGGQSIVPLSQKKPPFWRQNRPARQILFSGYHLKSENLPAYIDHIIASGARWIHGYPSHLAIIASFLLEKGINLTDRIDHVTTGAESFLANQRELLEKAFGVNVREHYSLAEAVANISECPQGKLHVDEDFSAVEFLPGGDEEHCAIIGTNFTNPAFPLLRYDTGDVARGVKTASDCSCGRGGRVVESVDGRIEDFILLKDGTRIGRMDHILKKMTHIREAQIYQKEPGRFQLRIVRRPEYTDSDQQQLIAETTKRVGPDTEIDLKYVDRLERTSRGKLRFVISDIDEARIGSGQT